MGMFDTFSGFNDKCPECGTILKDYQTKEFSNSLREWKIGELFQIDHVQYEQEMVSTLKIIEGSVTAYDWCKNCKGLVYTDIVIKNGKVDHSENHRIKSKKSIDIA